MIPLRLVSWEYDEVKARFVATFVNSPLNNDPNPAEHQPTDIYRVELRPQDAKKIDISTKGETVLPIPEVAAATLLI